MKPLYTLLCLLFSIQSFGQNCCPNFINIRDSINCNHKDMIYQPGGTQGGTDVNFILPADSNAIRVCRNTKMKYSLLAYSQAPCSSGGFTIDSITVVGGILVNNSNSDFCIQWGNGSTGSVLIKFHIPGGSVGGPGCTSAILLNFILVANPIANFTIAPNPACFNNPTTINFNSSSSVGAASYFWDFGDGFTSTAINPSHAYTSPGTYTVCLTITSTSSGNGTQPFAACPSCTDSICKQVVIENLPGPDITCIASVCAGETATYCTSASCSTYNWTVIGGTIVGADSLQCVTVLWGSGNPQGILHLDVPGCAGFCPQGTDIIVPIIPLSTNINGATIVCVGSTNTYSLQSFPGTTYSWNISGGQPINGNNTNTPQIVTTWNNLGTYTITCNYYDTALNCGGVGTIVVKVLPEMKVNGPKQRCAGQNGNYSSIIPGPNTPVPCNWSISPTGASFIGGSTSVASVNINWANAGSYTIKAVPSNPNLVCDSVLYTVIVHPIPVISAITGKDTICGGSTGVYAAVSNQSGVFTWNVTGGSFVGLNVNNDSVQITWNANGPYSIVVTQLSAANNCPSLPFTKTIGIYPTPLINGATNVCADNTVTYTISNISAGFNWYVTPAQFGTVLSAPGANPVQIKWHGNNNPGGTNTVYLHYGICGNDSIAITITEPIAPMVTATGTLCPGGVTLSTTATGTYSWSCVEHAILPTQTLTNASITNLSLPGNYNVTVLNPATGCTTIGTYNVPDVGRPDAQIFANGSIVYCLSSLPTLPNMTLSAVNVVGYSFQWFLNNTPVGTGSILNVTSALVNGLGSFPFKCVVTYNGCTDTSNIITISVIPCIGGDPNPFPPCGASFAITAIAGCNPFTFTLGNLNPVGSTIVSGTTSVFHYDDNSTLMGNTSKAFTSIGVKQVRICATILKPDNSTCNFCRDTTVTVTVASKFLPNVSCNTITLTDQSSVVSPAFINNYAWSVSPSGTFNNNAIASPVLTVPSSGSYTITQTVIASNGCVTSSSQIINIALPDADFNVINSCVGTVINLSTINVNTSTYWNFGDATSSATNPTSHAYATTGTFTITCSVMDAFGCKDTVKKPITIIAAPTCNITVTGLTTFCSGDSVKLDACAGFTNYQWLNNGVAISGATNMVYYATQTGNYHFTAANPSQCGVASDTISVNVNLSPSTTFSQIGSTCLGSNYSIDVPSCAGCFYIWEVDGIVEQSGLSNQLAGFVGSTPFTVGPHLIKVTVLGSNGCSSIDSIIVQFNPLPTITCSVVGNPAMLCSNNIYTLTASSSASNPSWSWTLTGFNNILSSTFSLTASVAGIYNTVVTDGLTGCTNSCSQFINESPDLSLFPIGCDTLCQNETIFLPLPSVFGNLFGYTITWYDNAPPYTNIVGTGISLNLSSLALGPHNLSVIVIGPNGCADTSNVYYIYIVPSTSSVTNATACGSYLWAVNGISYTQSGTYTSSTINASGCPQYDTLHLIITNSIGASMTDTACDIYTWNANGNTYTQSGTYVHTTMLANGCIKSDTLFLVINKSTDVVTTIVKCGSYTWPANSVTYTASGTYSFTSVNQNGCTQYNVLQLIITNAGSSTTTITTCSGSYTWQVNGITYTNSGTYVYTYLTQDSCTQTDSLILTLNSGSTIYDTISACNFYTWNINNQTYTASGIYTHTVLNPATGCLETYVLVLTINTGVDSTLIITTCGPYTWQINGVTYTASGYYTFTTLTPQGCLSFYGLHLTISNGGEYHDTIKTCDSMYTWNVNNQTYTISGVYTHTVLDPATNCIVYYYLHLTIHPPCNTIQVVNACDIYTWDVNGVTYTASGTYTHTYTNANGCVCTKTLILTIQTTTIITTYIDTCGYYIWPVNGETYTASCVYTYTVLSPNGCPTIYILCLTISQHSSDTLIKTACNSYTWPANGQTYTTSGVYSFTTMNAAGCIHTSTLILTIHYSSASTYTATACAFYLWPINNVTYTASGTYTFTTLNEHGCLHINTLNLTIHPATSSVLNITTCDMYTWAATGLTYTTSGVYTKTTLNANGCLHTATLNLTIHYTTTNTYYITACSSYLWMQNGVTYTASGVYTILSFTPSGCPHVKILCLTILPNTASTVTIVQCNQYTWPLNGVTYTASGTYTHTSLNAYGCLHTTTLNLTIHPSTTSSTSITVCGSYTWPINGVIYTASGTYIHTNLNMHGCPNSDTLHLVILPPTSDTIFVNACDEYFWNANGQTYTASGTYTYTTLNTNGCPHIKVLVLNLGHTTYTSHCDSVCDSYLWAQNGNTYTSSGVYTYTVIGPDGCPHIYILCLTVLPNTTITTNLTVCSAYTWSANGVTYTQSGIYTHTSINSFGCTHTSILHLTVHPVVVYNHCDTACGSYTWPYNGVTYTTSGIYSVVSIDANGCPEIHTLCITIYPNTETIDSVIACGFYSWPVNGVSYTASGTYTHTSMNANGCIHTNILQLTIGTTTVITHNCDTACVSYTWPLNNVTYILSGVYTVIVPGTDGCPQIHVLCITIHHPTQSDTLVTATNTYTWPINNQTYTASGIYTATIQNTVLCDSVITLHLDIIQIPSNSFALQAKVFLNGSYNAATGLMEDELRSQHLIPLIEPYSSAPMFKPQLLGGGGESTSTSVLNITGSNAIVDWVHIEIRSAANYNLLHATKNALLQRDGDIVSSTDGVSPLLFTGLPAGNYYISVKHRNHLGVMMANAISLSLGTLSYANFTNMPLHVVPSIVNNTPAKMSGSIQTLWSGDPNYNKNVKYNGMLNDKDPILISVGISTPNNTVYGYRLEDLNMDGKVRYNNTDNDRAIILNNVGVTTTNKILSQHTPN